MAKTYAWSDIYNGGEVVEVATPRHGTRNVIGNRNVTKRGEEVTQAKLKLSKEEWDHMLETGSIREYPLPKDADEYTSPTQAVLNTLSSGGEIDQNMLLELALTQPAASAEPEPAPEVPKGA